LNELVCGAQHIALHAAEWKVFKDNKSELHDLKCEAALQDRIRVS
jgi:hypothetical protein